MTELINLPLYAGSFEEFADREDCRKKILSSGCGGIEGIWGGEAIPDTLPADLLCGYHLIFYPDWLDFYRGRKAKVLEKFGNEETIRQFYGGTDADILVRQYRDDLERAVQLGAKYVVFHVSDVSVEESYTYRWDHTNREVIDAAAELINTILDGREWPFLFLVENQWWPGFTFTEPEETARLLDRIHTAKKGILLDTGHLMNTCTRLRTEREGIDYIHAMLDKNGSLSKEICAMHLHQSLSGAYVQENTGSLPELPEDYFACFGVNYSHILRIDRHLPWTDCAVQTLIERIEPQYLTHELSGGGLAARAQALLQQRTTLGFC
ncbi:MAG: TIM barrel protein [Clostridia bacterium]|nr:TIM barrel protein [Clostridia bacterium]